MALLLIVATFWGIAYLTPLPTSPSDWGNIYARILEEVGYFRMVLMWFVLFLVLYGVAFLVSALTDRPGTAMAGGLLAALVFHSIMTGVTRADYLPLGDYLQLLPVLDYDGRALILVSATGVNRLPDIEIRPRWFGVVFSLAVRADRPVPGSIQTDLWVWPRRTVRPASCHRGV